MAIIPDIAYRISPLMYFFLALMAIWLLVNIAQRCRNIRLAGLADELNLQLFSWDPLYLPQRYEQMYLFRQGHARRARNVMIGRHQGQQLRLFDYLYETGSGPHRHTHQFSVVIMQVSHDLPGLLVQTGQKHNAQYTLTGMAQLKLKLLPLTAKQGSDVFCQNAKFAQDYVNEQLLGNLTKCKGSSLEVQDGVLALYVPGKRTVGEYRQLKRLANELAKHIASYNPQIDQN